MFDWSYGGEAFRGGPISDGLGNGGLVSVHQWGYGQGVGMRRCRRASA